MDWSGGRTSRERRSSFLRASVRRVRFHPGGHPGGLGAFPAHGGSDATGELWRCLIPRGTEKALLADREGQPVAVEHSFGRGRAIYYGTALTLACLRRASPQLTQWIAAPAAEASRDLSIRLTAGPEWLAFRAMEANGRAAAVLNNWGGETRATVRFPRSVESLVEIFTGKPVAMRGAGSGVAAEIVPQEGGSGVLLAAAP